jgi:mannose-6-phosphate isomerase-like protein (cupin superfamily)
VSERDPDSADQGKMPAMYKQLPGFLAGVIAGAALVALALTSGTRAEMSALTGQGQSTSKIVLENDRVRVKDVTFPPGVTGMHTHDLPHVGVVIQGGTLEFRYPDGKSETAKLEAGGVGYRDANVTHEPVNPGKTPVRVIEVELK